MPLDFETDLNEQQLAAVTHGDGPQLVLAGAGSGKTRVITYRIAWLIQERGVDPAAITAVTFTNKAAQEMHGRVEGLVARYPLTTFLGTFHRYALRLLRRYGERLGLNRDFAILDSDDQAKVVREALSLEGLSEKAFPPRTVLSAISGAKNRLEGPEVYAAAADHFFTRKVAQIYRRYQGLLRKISGVDFDDMIAYSVKLLEEDERLGERLRQRVDHLLVDEYQDTNHAQLRLVRALAGEAANLTAVGDEDQGIYRWRGADLNNILQFENSFPGATIRKLERNYRSTQTILDASGALVSNNRGRRGKTLWTDSGTGELIELYKAGDEGDEARWLVNTLQGLRGSYELGQMAILVRTNAQTRSLEEELLRQGVAYELVGGTRFYDRAEIKDLIAYLRVLRNPRDDFSFLRVLNQPPRGIGKATQDLLRQRAEELGQPLWDTLDLDDLGSLPKRSATALKAFRNLVHSLKRLAEQVPLPSLLEQLLEATSYTDLYRPEDPDGQARLENIREFLSAAQDFTEKNSFQSEDDDLLTAFLDHVSLVSDIDSWQGRQGLSVMTLHSAKGLEFPVVAVSGLEEGILPHFNAQRGEDDIEEERRLLYVGMTRARERLILSACSRRRIAGRYQDQKPSPFVAEIPERYLNVTESPNLFKQRTDTVYSFFGRDGSARGPASTGQRRYVPVDDDAGENPFQRGVKVRHTTLGEGEVLETDGQGDNMKIIVYFRRAGKRKLVARFANLEVI